MDLEKDVLNNLLKERGMLDFKPFIDKGGSEQLWGYCTQTGDCKSFHLCKSNLEEVPTTELSKDTSGFRRPFYLIRVSEESYSVLPEGVDITATSDSGWLVNSKNEVISTSVPGYSIIGFYLILSAKLEEKSFGPDDVLCWMPQEQYPMYLWWGSTLDNDDNTMMYCASYGCHIGHSKYGYFVFDSYGYLRYNFRFDLTKESYYYVDSFLVFNTGLYYVRCFVEQNFELVWEAYKFIDKSHYIDVDVDVVVQLKTGIKINPNSKVVSLNDCQIEWCCSHKYFALTNYQTNSNVKSLCIASWSWEWSKSTFFSNYSKLYLYVLSQTLCSTIIESDNYLVRVGDDANGVVVLGNVTSGRYFIYDIYGEILADNVLKKNEYAIITKSIPDKGHLITTTDDNYLLSGVIRMEDLSVVVPMQYQEIIIESTHPDLVVVGRTDFGDKSKYELLKNGDVILPRTISDCELSKMKSNDMVLVREGEKYDIIYRGERCLPSRYDIIEETKPDAFLTVTSNKKSWLYVINSHYLSKGFQSLKIVYVNDYRVFFVGDNALLMICGRNEKKIIEDCPSLKFICCDKYEWYFVFHDNQLGYVCFDNQGNKVLLKEDYCDQTECYKIEDKDLWFIPKDELITDILWKYMDHDNYHGDDYDYEEDTYYALGGTDYDKFRENGGSIDDMMDGMGL